MKSRLVILFLVLITLASAQTQWDTAVPLRQGANIEWFRTAIPTDDGGMIYSWSDTRFGDRDLWAMKYDSNGNSAWGDEPLLVDNKIDRQEDPVIIETSNNDYIIAWLDFSNDQNGDVYAQKISDDGQLMWQDGGVAVCSNPEIQISLNIVEDDEGGAYILWKDSRNPSQDLYAAHLNSQGVNQWTADGHPIANTDLSEGQNSMREDGFGGFVIAYIVEENNQKDIYVKRINSDGTSEWGEPKELVVETGNQESVKVVPDGLGGYVFAWQDARYTSSDIYAHRILANGDYAWTAPVVVYGDEPSNDGHGQNRPRLREVGNGSVVVVWEDTRNTIELTGVYAQKLNSDGVHQWNADGVEIAPDAVREGSIRTSDDGNGGVYVVWTDARTNDYPQVDIYAQHVESDGTFGWNEDGMIICDAINEQNNALIKKSGDNVFAVWFDLRTGSLGITQQIVTAAGSPILVEDGETVFIGLSGDAGAEGELQAHGRPSQDDAVVLWQDTRGASNGYQIMFQYVNEDGSIDLDVNGKAITISTGTTQAEFDSAVNNQGQTCVVWIEQRGSTPKVYAQLLDVDGSYLWGDTGLEMTPTFATIGQSAPNVSWNHEDGDFYIGWADLIEQDFSYYNKVYGQRMHNGDKQWGDNGLLLSDQEAGSPMQEAMINDIVGSYYLWSYSAVKRRVAKVNQDGSIAEGYSVEGNLISTADASVDNGNGVVVDDQLYYVWADNRDDYIFSIFAQGFADDGTEMFDNDIEVTPSLVGGAPHEAKRPSIVAGEDGLYTVWHENLSDQDVRAQKINFDGTSAWGERGLEIGIAEGTQTKPAIGEISRGYYISAWEDAAEEEIDISMNVFRYNGDVLWSNAGADVTTERKDQKNPKVASIGDGKAFITWADGISSGKTTILGVYAQFVDVTTVPVADNDVAPVNSVLNQNYPNPFNPETNISFTLNKDVKDVELSIYNIKGQKVSTLVNEDMKAGTHNIVWNGVNNNNQSVASGVYFYKLKAGKQTSTRKMVLMK